MLSTAAANSSAATAPSYALATPLGPLALLDKAPPWGTALPWAPPWGTAPSVAQRPHGILLGQ